MSIRYDENSRCFHLDGTGMSYVIRLAAGRWPLHLHFGAPLRKITDDTLARLSPYTDETFTLHELPLDRLPQECPVFGTADLREGLLHVRHADGTSALDPVFHSYSIFPGRETIPGLPFAEGEGAETLRLTLFDEESNLFLHLFYTLWSEEGILARHMRIENRGVLPVTLERALSFTLDFEHSDFRLLTESGAWARERQIVMRPLVPGEQGVSSLRGHSSAQASPFLALLTPCASEASGEVYGFSLAYSGNFLASANVDQDGATRVLLGIHPFEFSWRLASGESFDTPEAYLCYSSEGLSGMSRLFHRFIRRHIFSGPWVHTSRPILINNWEATYFSFNEDKLLRLAEEAKNTGIDLFVLDDGWFGCRDNDFSSLGDWTDDDRKLPDGLSGLSRKIHALGLRFGLWVEPEMISPDSELYRTHPDWCIHAGNRPRLESRHQLVLDLTREEVRENIVSQITAALTRGNVDYVKWDMNRSISLAASPTLSPECMKEFRHRYILGLYEIIRTITKAFPKVLFESCASGGGRFDLGIMRYMPQAWTSDDTDAWERCRIQYGTSLVFPPECMGAHVSAVPNHQTGRITPLFTRAAVAMGGTYGYELDLCALKEEEREAIRMLNARVHQWQEVLLYGTLERLLSPFEHEETAWMIISPDCSRAVVTHVQSLAKANTRPRLLRLRGLHPEKQYRDEDSGKIYGGDELMARGLPLLPTHGDFAAQQFFLRAV